MTGGARQGINASLAQPQIARPIVLLARTPLDAVYAAGVEITQSDEEFLRKIPRAVWTDLQAHILAAFTAGHTPQLDIRPGPAYSLQKGTADDGGVVELVILGPIPDAAS
jgi:hypothetical protein